jgi:hypothetical protein|tara:strand:+ start:1046 stop:1345 length:300 start_codon:yes stop_codon:yes gene_type:complete
MELSKLQAQGDQNVILTALKKWQEASNNPELAEITLAQIRLFTYINSIELEQYSYNKILGEFRTAKNNAVIRARKAENALETLEAEVISLRNKVKIFGG